MRRRDFLRVASGAAGGAATAGAAAAASDGGTAATGAVVRQQNNTTVTGNGTGNGTATGNATGNGTAGGAAGGGTETVTLVDYAFEGATESPLYVTPGTTVNFVWETDNHNIVVSSQPEGANWQGHETIENSPFEYSHTFTTTGEYAFYCRPHQNLGMEGTIVVNESGQPPGGEGGGAMSPHEMGVPFQAHYVGIATVVMMVVSLIFTFFTLKYGESSNASSPNRE